MTFGLKRYGAVWLDFLSVITITSLEEMTAQIDHDQPEGHDRESENAYCSIWQSRKPFGQLFDLARECKIGNPFKDHGKSKRRYKKLHEVSSTVRGSSHFYIA